MAEHDLSLLLFNLFLKDDLNLLKRKGKLITHLFVITKSKTLLYVSFIYLSSPLTPFLLRYKYTHKLTILLHSYIFPRKKNGN